MTNKSSDNQNQVKGRQDSSDNWQAIGDVLGYDTTKEQIVEAEAELVEDDFVIDELPFGKRPSLQLGVLALTSCTAVGLVVSAFSGGMNIGKLNSSNRPIPPQPDLANADGTVTGSNNEQLAEAQARLALEEQQRQLNNLQTGQSSSTPATAPNTKPTPPKTNSPRATAPTAKPTPPTTDRASVTAALPVVVRPEKPVRFAARKIPSVRGIPVVTPRQARDNQTLDRPSIPTAEVAVKPKLVAAASSKPAVQPKLLATVPAKPMKQPPLATETTPVVSPPAVPDDSNGTFGGRFIEVASNVNSDPEATESIPGNKEGKSSNKPFTGPEDGVLNGRPVNATHYLQIGMEAQGRLATAVESSAGQGNINSNEVAVTVTQPFKVGENNVLPVGAIVTFKYTIADNGYVAAQSDKAYYNNQEIPLPPGVFKLANDRGQALIANYRQIGADRVASLTTTQAIYGAAARAGEVLTAPDQTVVSNSGIGGSSFSSSTTNNRNIVGAVIQGAGTQYLNAQVQQNTAEQQRLNGQSRLWTLDRGTEVSIIVLKPTTLTIPSN